MCVSSKVERYPLLLRVAAEGLAMPGGHRWDRNPSSHSEKVTQNTGGTPPHTHLLTRPIHRRKHIPHADSCSGF